MKNRNFWLSLVLLISLGVTAIDITRAVNPPMPTIPGECEFLRAPTSGVLGSRQTPDPVEVGDTFTVEWHVTGDGGGYIPAHPDKNSPPPEQPLDKWGTHGKRFDGEGSADFWTEPVTYRARLTGSTTVEYFFGDLNYFNPCDKSYHTANTPTAIHTPNIIPRPPGDPPPDPPTGDDPPPPPGVPPLPEEGEGGTNTGAEKPDHGEVLGDGEIIDEDSIVTDPDRGDIPTSGKVLVFLDPAPATPEALPGGNEFERIVLTHRIVTINSPDARPLDGTLRLEVVEGDPENFEIHYFDPENSAAQEITSFPFEEMITEPGHHGGGVHDWHSGTVSLNVRAISRPESPGEEPHLILRASADPVQGAPKKTLDVVLLPVGIEEVISDQISGSECNKLPTAFFKGESNNPMLMATRSGTDAHLAIKMNVPSSPPNMIYVGVRKTATTNIIDSVPAVAPPAKTLLQFTAIDGHEIYEVVAGADADGNGALDDSEATIVFEKTPKVDAEGNPATASLDLLDRIIIVTDTQFQSSKSTVIGYNVIGTDYAGDLIEAFARGSTSVPTTTVSTGITLSSTTPGLSHKVGAKWDTSCNDTTYRFTFPDGVEASNHFEGSNALDQIIDEVIQDNIDALLAAGSGTVTTSSQMSFTISKDLIVTEDPLVGFNELGLAFGKVDITGNLRIKYSNLSATSIDVDEIEVIGDFDDLYDFAYGGGTRARQAAMVQSGHATLSSAAEPAGKVFFTRLEYDTGWRSHGETYTK